MERIEQLAAVVAAHPDRKVVGRTRLQKEIKLLQRVGLDTDYGYSLHFYGPYSEELHEDLRVAEHFGLLSETQSVSGDGSPYYVFRAADAVKADTAKVVKSAIEVMVRSTPVVLELAATYDAFREAGHAHEDALSLVKLKKGDKCTAQNIEAALLVLKQLGLTAS